MLEYRHVQPFSLVGHIRYLESYHGLHQYLLDEALFILLKNCFKWSLKRLVVCGVVSSISNYQPHANYRLVEKL